LVQTNYILLTIRKLTQNVQSLMLKYVQVELHK